MDLIEIPRYITSGILNIWMGGVKKVYLNVGCFNRKLPGVLFFSSTYHAQKLRRL